ncbi:hypothetical protein [Xanthomonas campestris]|uniref:hypothetical protein n=1 Tax=Xanthomonas campestris TaxID=339 RepID=UPI00388CFB8A
MAEGTELPGFQAIANVAASPATHVALMADSLLAQTDLFRIGVAMFGPRPSPAKNSHRCRPDKQRNSDTSRLIKEMFAVRSAMARLGSAASHPGAGPCGGMDAATEPPWTDSRRVPLPDAAPRVSTNIAHGSYGDCARASVIKDAAHVTGWACPLLVGAGTYAAYISQEA